MTTIELTKEQRQALQTTAENPIVVVDPITRQRYVLLAGEQYERLRPFLECTPQLSSSPPRSGVGPLPAEGGAERVRLRDLATPPEVLAEVDRWCKKFDQNDNKRRLEIEEHLKLQFYYGGQPVYVLRLSDGPVVIPIAEHHRNTPELRYVLLTAEERTRACLDIPARWGETASEILS